MHLATPWKDVALVLTGHAQSTEPEIGVASSGRLDAGDLLTIIQTMETLPLADVKARLSELIARVQQQHDQVTVTRNGRPAAVVVSIDEWESLQETLEILSDPAAVAAIVEARDAVSRGEVFTTKDILTDLAARRAQSA